MAPVPISAILQHYEKKYRKQRDDELKYFKEQPTLKSAISKAAVAEGPRGRRFKHQNRLKRADLERAEQALAAREKDISAAKSFDELHTIVLDSAKAVWKDPELYAYDTACRIGAKLNLSPDKVYLHRGTREGARNLGLDTSGAVLNISELPKNFKPYRRISLRTYCAFIRANSGKSPKPRTRSRYDLSGFVIVSYAAVAGCPSIAIFKPAKLTGPGQNCCSDFRVMER